MIFAILLNTTAFAATQQERIKYAKKYVTYYERIEVGATAKTSGKEGRTLKIRLKYRLDDFVVSVAMRYINEWKNLGFSRVIVSDADKSWSYDIK